MTFAIQVAIDAISLGSFYALAALGIGLLFGVLRLINFAHGDFITIGVYALIVPSLAVVATMFVGAWPWPVLIIAVVAIVVIFALASELLVFRPLRNASPATLMISSFALGYVLQNLILMIYGSRPKAIGLWSELNFPVEIGALRVPQLQLVTIGVTFGLLAALVLFLRKTHYGVQMRAAAEDFRMARLMGVRANLVIGVAFATSGLLASVVSLLYVTQVGMLTPQMGIQPALIGFVATVVGGLGSLLGATIGGFFIGALTVTLQILLPLELRPFRDAFVFSILFMVLLVRPGGLIVVPWAKERI